MSEKTVNQEANNPTGGTSPEKTFTQSQLDAIVAERLARDRKDRADYDDLKAKAAELDKLKEAGRSELEKAQTAAADYKAKLEALQTEKQIRDARDKVSAETGIPAGLLSGSTEEECKAHAEALLKWRGGGAGAPNHGVDHLLGGKQDRGGTETDAAFAELRDGLFKSI
ncbi:MAG: DUF4355 domain-containing protein [Clostridia bacterium]|nr:DUF4355 domain-containing protein [Clostridia bacterium]